MIVLDEPTAEMRFINRDGKRILQQRWRKSDMEMKVPPVFDWRDIPYIPGAEQGDMTVHP